MVQALRGPVGKGALPAGPNGGSWKFKHNIRKAACAGIPLPQCPLVTLLPSVGIRHGWFRSTATGKNWAVGQVNICWVNHRANLIRSRNVPGSLLKLNSPPIKERATSFHHTALPPGCPSPKTATPVLLIAGAAGRRRAFQVQGSELLLVLSPRHCKEIADALNKSPSEAKATSVEGFSVSARWEKTEDAAIATSLPWDCSWGLWHLYRFSAESCCGPTCPMSAPWSRASPSKRGLRREQRGHRAEQAKTPRL